MYPCPESNIRSRSCSQEEESERKRAREKKRESKRKRKRLSFFLSFSFLLLSFTFSHFLPKFSTFSDPGSQDRASSATLQSTIGDDGFLMVNEKKRQWFSKIAIYDKKLLLEFTLNTTISLCQTLWKYEYFQVPSMHLKSSWLEKWHLYGQARAEKLAKVYINPRTLSCFGQSFTSLVQFPCSMTERVQNS